MPALSRVRIALAAGNEGIKERDWKNRIEESY